MTKSLVKETGTNSSQSSAYVQMPGSHVIPSYYGVRRPYLSDSDLPHCPSSKHYSADVYSSSLSSKSFGCEPPAVTGYQHLLDPYITETFGDYRTPTFPTATSSIFAPQPLAPLFPPFPNESPHFLLRDSWDSVQENVNHGSAICDTLQQMQATAANCQAQHHGNHSMPDTESASSSQYKNVARNSGEPSQSSQPYPLHPMEEMHFSPGFPVTSAYGCAPFMTVSSELATKTIHLSSEESADTTPSSLIDMSSWAKEDGSTGWPLYEVRRTY
ncbi:POU domain class 2-associating factor 2 [Mobula hypostoma]|uniref:POU domain class 2-associating factor 2 n=1 Tax=Mobula hypostoma TaxID=723540 RepID=UPI002FC3DC4F